MTTTLYTTPRLTLIDEYRLWQQLKDTTLVLAQVLPPDARKASLVKLIADNERLTADVGPLIQQVW